MSPRAQIGPGARKGSPVVRANNTAAQIFVCDFVSLLTITIEFFDT